MRVHTKVHTFKTIGSQKMVKLKILLLADNQASVEVDRETMRPCNLIETMIAEDEEVTEEIPLDLELVVFNKIKEYLRDHYPGAFFWQIKRKPIEIPPIIYRLQFERSFTRSLLSTDKELFYKVLLGADYLDCRPLVDECLYTIAKIIQQPFDYYQKALGVRDKTLGEMQRVLEQNKDWFSEIKFDLSPLPSSSQET